jgi:ribosome-binding ATPase YchF (GTP1/OBG family)
MLELGLVGKPNTGKSTFFNATTLADVPVAGYPFTTIDANVGVTYVRSECPCQDFDVKCDPKNSRCVNGVRHVPVRVIDVAGLVEGAYEGRGLGNQFLDNLRMAAALVHIIDAAGATDTEGKPCSPGTHDPVNDVKFLENEIDQWLRGILTKGWKKFARQAKLEGEKLDSSIAERLSGLGIKRHHVSSAMRAIEVDRDSPDKWSDEDLSHFASELRRISKPIMIAANKMDLSPAKENVEKLRGAGRLTIPTSAEMELALRRASEKGLIKYTVGGGDFEILKPDAMSKQQLDALESIRKVLKEWGSTGVQQVVDKAIYDLLDMIVVYPVDDENKLTDKKGNVLPDAFLVPKGTTAKGFAYLIHTDLGKSFIHAIDARTKRRIGEDYKLKNRDVIRIVAAKGR